MNKKEMRREIKTAYAEDQKSYNERLKDLNTAEKKAEKAKYKKRRHDIIQQYKTNIKTLSNAHQKDEKKSEKVRLKTYRKLKNRPIKYSLLALLFMILAFAGLKAAPIIGDISELMSVEISSDSPEAEAARLLGEALSEEISDEGIVLLKNDENLLPLQSKKVNVFGYNALDFRHGGAGSGGADQSRSISLFDGLKSAGIEYNPSLLAFYNEKREEVEKAESKNKETGLMAIVKSRLGMDAKTEPAIGYLTDEVIAEAQAYSDTAILVFSASSVESSDTKLEDLKLNQNQRDLLDKISGSFKHIIILINSGNPMELGFLEEYDNIDAALWVGTPGARGTISIGKILAGAVNPSGRLTDTYAYNVGSNPASVNFGDFKYDNIEKLSFLNYSEGIYVGYRFYETYYQTDEEGYRSVVQYPFGYGLSYTDFKWEIVNQSLNSEEIALEVKVTNTGDVAGKEVLQVYFSAPYAESGIEKSAIELGGYGKTNLLMPGASEVVKISFPTRDMASYDMNDTEAYVLEKGTYEIKLSKNVHTPVATVTYDVADTVVYETDDVTGVETKNEFKYAQGDVNVLSRSDWEGTYPTLENLNTTASSEMVESFYARPEPETGELPVTGAENGLLLSDLKGTAYDDPKWQSYLDQFTVEELIKLFTNGGWKTIAVDRLGLPETVLLDGPAGINFFFKSLEAASYPTEIIIAATWNDALALKMGDTIGAEAKILGVHGWYAPGLNIHRTPQGGRNFEYFSEDPLLSGRMAANMIKGAQANDIMVFMKHFVLNDQEINARKGVAVWIDEQTLREIYLRPFEIAVKDGGATGVMSSFIHIGPKWSSGNPELLNNVLRNEWGFTGIVSSDAVQAWFMDPELALRNGNDLMLNPAPSLQEKTIKALYKEDPVGVTKSLKERVHNIAYSILNYTNAVE